jgi:hypothetical protein
MGGVLECFDDKFGDNETQAHRYIPSDDTVIDGHLDRQPLRIVDHRRAEAFTGYFVV